MIKHLLTLIWNQRKSNALITVELFLIFILLWVCNYQLYSNLKRLHEPIGFDFNHVYKVNMSELPETHPDWEDNRNKIEEIYTLIDRIKECPGIEHVSLSSYAIPFSSYSNTLLLSSSIGATQVKHGDIFPEFF
ncbi:MAG: hypothetical protein LIP01_05085 [Tannerellaceae bacterium]|nr:hypothetical protein [Tannerellaceae bacterium]